jgi:twitching motility protein PilI
MSQPESDFIPNQISSKPDSTVRRTRLREFQTQLVARMQTARSGEETRRNQLGVQIGDRRWLLDLHSAGEIVSVGAITKVPLTQPWFLGLTNIRGSLISVIDFAHFLGLPPTSIDKDSRIVAFASALSFNSSLLVDRILGLRNVADMQLQTAAESGSLQGASYMDNDAHLWTELDLSHVVQDAQFLHVGL